MLKDVRMKVVNSVLLFFVLILCVVTYLISMEFSRRNKKFLQVTDTYYACTDAVSSFQQTSSFLTEMAGYFINNMDSQFLFNYFEELEDIGSRDRGLAVLEDSPFDSYIVQNFKNALYDSNQLSQYEIYAMKLVTETDAFRKTGQNLPEQLNSIQVVTEDKRLSDSEKIEKARVLVFGSGYFELKKMILNHSRMAAQNLLDEAEFFLQENSDSFNKFVSIEKSLLVLIVVISVISFLLVSNFLLNPLIGVISSIDKGQPLEKHGSYELIKLINIYNKLLEKTKANEGELKYEAEHDGLTGLINRGGYGRIVQALELSPSPVGLILIDVDKFKEVNDEYGHSCGDSVLMKVADILAANFRSSDYVARVGGDEFAVIMTSFGDGIVEMLKEKLTAINMELNRFNGTMPRVSLSMGVAISRRGYSKALYDHADEALYKVKERGRNGFEFYVQEEESGKVSDVEEPDYDL